MELRSGSSTSATTNSKGRCLHRSGGNRRGKGNPRPYEEESKEERTTEDQSQSVSNIEVMGHVSGCSTNTEVMGCVSSCSTNTNKVMSHMYDCSTTEGVMSRSTRSRRSSSLSCDHASRFDQYRSIEIEDDLDYEPEEEPEREAGCSALVASTEETPPSDELLYSTTFMKPSTEETPPRDVCPYGADLVSIFETSEMYLARRDRYRPTYEHEIFLRQTIEDIGIESTQCAIANEIKSRTNASSIAVSVNESKKSAVAAIQIPSTENDTDGSYHLEQLFAFDLEFQEDNIISHSGLLPRAEIVDQSYVYKISETHSSFCDNDEGRLITRVMLSEDPVTAAKIHANCKCQEEDLIPDPDLEVQYCDYSEDYTLLSSSYGRMYNFAPTSESVEEAIQQAIADDGGWEYLMNARRTPLYFLSALKYLKIEDLVYLFIISRLMTKKDIRPGVLRRVYFNPR